MVWTSKTALVSDCVDSYLVLDGVGLHLASEVVECTTTVIFTQTSMSYFPVVLHCSHPVVKDAWEKTC